jgi:heme exporter protein CcmD
MNWGNLDAFLDMGGYSTYVWGSYIVSAVAIAIEVVLLLRRHRTLRARAGRSSRNPETQA